MRVLVVGGGAREHAIAEALRTAGATIVVASPNANPGLDRIAATAVRLDPTDPPRVVGVARQNRVEYAVIGPEAPLAAGVADALRAVEIPVVGPSKDGAIIETSKRYCRDLMAANQIPGLARFIPVSSAAELDAAVAELGERPFVVKPVGLTQGKGVKVQGVDFATAAEGRAYAQQLLQEAAGSILLEERVDGEEFSLLAFVTDSGVYPMPLVHDYKRALEGDQGPNTGGMGAFSQRDHLLPFVSNDSRDRALAILQQIVAAMRAQGRSYRGILYGGFMETASGPVLLECNARFGDPEGINVLTLYEEGNLDALLFGVAAGRVDPNLVRFRPRATVVKYVVPPGYGRTPEAGGVLEIDAPEIDALGVHVRYGSVEAAGPGRFTLGTSRGLALVGEASAIHEAGARVEAALAHVHGRFEVRHDIASKADLTMRTERVRQLKAPGAKASPIPLSVAPPTAPPSSAADPSLIPS